MEEKESLKNKFILHTVSNIIAFALIFFIFGIFVYFMVRNITYNSVDKELKNSVQNLTESNLNNTVIFQFPKTLKSDETEDIIEEGIRGYQDYFLTKKLKSPRIIMVLRDENGEILNQEELGKIADYVDDLKPYTNVYTNKIYEIKLGGIYNYRCLNLKIDYDDDTQDRYVQLLINVDSEKALINSYTEIIASAVAIGILLSIVASLILAKRTLKPLEENLEKQMEFVQNASHELRTPLTIIQAKQELLLQEPNAKIIDKSEEIMLTLNETKRLTKLTKDLMTISRADKKSMNLQKENVNLDNFIENLAKPYMEIAEMQSKKLLLNLKYENDVSIDTNRMYQLLIILLDNAIKYTEENDTIEIHTYMKENKCVIEVKDTGIGVSDEGLKRIFERFYREDDARNRETGGSGLGLSIATLIVSAHGGNIKATHNNPKGTVFIVRLPKQ